MQWYCTPVIQQETCHFFTEMITCRYRLQSPRLLNAEPQNMSKNDQTTNNHPLLVWQSSWRKTQLEARDLEYKSNIGWLQIASHIQILTWGWKKLFSALWQYHIVPHALFQPHYGDWWAPRHNIWTPPQCGGKSLENHVAVSYGHWIISPWGWALRRKSNNSFSTKCKKLIMVRPMYISLGTAMWTTLQELVLKYLDFSISKQRYK